MHLRSVQSSQVQLHPHPHKNHPNQKKKKHNHQPLNKPQMQITDGLISLGMKTLQYLILSLPKQYIFFISSLISFWKVCTSRTWEALAAPEDCLWIFITFLHGRLFF